MKKKLLIVFLILVALIGVFAIIVALQPEDYKVTRSAAINAPAPVVFNLVNDFHNWDAWSPWAKIDRNCKNTISGSTSGKGAVFAWNGNSDVGEGKMTITDSKPLELIRIKLDFIRPFESTSDVDFEFKSAGASTNVIWTMSGKKDFISKAFCMFASMDKMVGGDFEKGLAQMKAEAEKVKLK